MSFKSVAQRKKYVSNDLDLERILFYINVFNKGILGPGRFYDIKFFLRIFQAYSILG